MPESRVTSRPGKHPVPARKSPHSLWVCHEICQLMNGYSCDVRFSIAREAEAYIALVLIH